MSETRGEYIKSNEITCQQCGKVIGHLEKIDDQEWLRVGRLVLRAAHGACECGAEWHWTVADRALAELVARVIGARL